MRLLGEEEREMIMGTLHRRISEEYLFHLPQDGVEVISGKMEGESCCYLMHAGVFKAMSKSVIEGLRNIVV